MSATKAIAVIWVAVMAVVAVCVVAIAWMDVEKAKIEAAHPCACAEKNP